MASKDAYADPALTAPGGGLHGGHLRQRVDADLPRPPKKPRFFYFSGPNPLRRWPNAKIIRDSLWKEIETIVTTDFRMSTSGMWSDYILPVVRLLREARHQVRAVLHPVRGRG